MIEAGDLMRYLLRCQGGVVIFEHLTRMRQESILTLSGFHPQDLGPKKGYQARGWQRICHSMMDPSE
jgi:hypothetical protein